MNRGEVYWVNFEPQLGAETKKIRPAVILSRQPFNSRRKTVIVIPLSKAHTRTEWPLLVGVHTTGAAVAVIDQLKAADKSRFGACLGRLTDYEMKEISEAVACVLDVP
jgi:mRNA interferase MazF